MSNEFFATFITAAMFTAVVGIIVFAQYTPLRLWYAWRTKFFDSNEFRSRVGQVGVVIIAAGILDGVFGDGSAGEVVAVNILGAELILFSSIKARSEK